MLLIELVGHLSSHIPQLMHFSVSITATLFLISIAVTGHAFSHCKHPIVVYYPQENNRQVMAKRLCCRPVRVTPFTCGVGCMGIRT